MPASSDNIATFVEVVRKQSLSAAARSLGLPKSTISRRLVRLEEELDSKLLHRDARKITLTATGRRFYESVVTAVDALGAAVTALEESSKAPRGSIRLTAPPDLGRMVLSPMLVAFLERYPDISLDLVLTSRTLDLVQEGIDMAVRAGRVTDEKLIAQKLCESQLQLAASPETARRWTERGQGDAAAVRALAQSPFVLYRAGATSQVIKLERASPRRSPVVELSVSGRINVDDYAAMAELVAAGHGLGLMPAIHVQDGVAAKRLVQVLPGWFARSAHVFLVYPTRQQPERVRLLAGFLRASFDQVHNV